MSDAADLDLATIDAAIAALQAKRAELTRERTGEGLGSADDLITSKQAAGEFGVTERTARRWANDKRFGVRRMGRLYLSRGRLRTAMPPGENLGGSSRPPKLF